MNNKGFVFSGMAILLILPVLIMAASFADVIKIGNAGVSLNLRTDRLFQVKNDLEETVVSASISSGRYNAHQATLNLSLKFEELTQESGLEYASLHSFYTDSEVSASDSKSIIEENIRDSINTALGEVIGDYSTSDVNIIINNGNNVTDQDISINQTEPFTFIVEIDSMPLYIDFGFTTYNGTLNSVTAVVPIEGLLDPYIFVKSWGRSTNRIFESPYGNNISSFLYNDTIGGGSSVNPRPYYHNNTEGLSFFCKLDGKTSSTCTDIDASKMETFVLGDPLSQTSASVVDHQYFENVAADGTATYNPPTEVPSASPNSYVFQLDCGHEIYYGLGSCAATTTTSTTTTTTTTSSTTTTLGSCSDTTIGPLYPDDDTYIKEDDGSDVKGNDDTFEVRRRDNKAKRILIKFNLSSIPANATISEANLSLRREGDDTGDTLRTYRITSNWDEGSANWNNMNDQYDSVVILDSATIQSGWTVFDLASSVESFIDGSFTNYGWLLKLDNDSNDPERKTKFYSKEWTGTSNDPILRITYCS